MTHNSKLEKYEEMLKTHFTKKRDNNPNSELYLLDHPLNESEIIEMEMELKKHWDGHDNSYFETQFKLCYLVSLTELAFEFNGQRFWPEAEKKFSAVGYPFYWDGYSQYKAKPRINEFYLNFQEEFNGVVPLGRWADTYCYMSRPITHAILPRNLQDKLFKFIRDSLESLDSESFETPKKLGEEIQKNYKARELQENSQFDTLFEHPTLLGTLVFNIAEKKPTIPEAVEELVNLEPRTFERIKERLNDTYRDGIKFRAGKALKKRKLMSLDGSGDGTERTKEKQRKNRKDGIYFSMNLEKISDRDEWLLNLNLPKIKNHQSLDSDILIKSTLEIRDEGIAEENNSILNGKSLKFSPSSFPIKYLVENDEPLITLKNQLDYRLTESIEKQFTPLTMLGSEPWLFKQDLSGLKATRVSSVFLNNKYLFLKRPSQEIELDQFISKTVIETENLELYEINIPKQLSAAEKTILDSNGLSVGSDLIELKPFGLNISPKNNQLIRYVRDDHYIFRLDVKETLSYLSLTFYEDDETSEKISEGICKKGIYFLSVAPSEIEVEHMTCSIFSKTLENIEYRETIDLEFFETEPWDPGNSHEVAFEVSFRDLEKKEYFQPSFEDLIENDFDVEITFPFPDYGEIELTLYDQDGKEIYKIGPIEIKSIRILKDDWDEYIHKEIELLDQDLLEEVTEAELLVSAKEFNYKKIKFYSLKVKELSFRITDDQIELNDQREIQFDQKVTIREFSSLGNKTIVDASSHLTQIGQYNVFDNENMTSDSIIFFNNLEYVDIDFQISNELDMASLIESYRSWYSSRAPNPLAREVRRRALLEINSMMIKTMLNDGDSWYQVETKYLKENNKIILEKGFISNCKAMHGNRYDPEKTLDYLKAMIDSKKKKQVTFFKNNDSEFDQEEEDLINMALEEISSELRVSSDGDIKNKLYIWEREDQFSSNDLINIEDSVRSILGNNIKVRRIPIDDWGIDVLIDEIQEEPSKFSMSRISLDEKSQQLAIQLATSPGILIHNSTHKRDFTRLQIQLSQNKGFLQIIRFLTLYVAKVKSERSKPLFRLWENSL
jgi:hypothetical protein